MASLLGGCVAPEVALTLAAYDAREAQALSPAPLPVPLDISATPGAREVVQVGPGKSFQPQECRREAGTRAARARARPLNPTHAWGEAAREGGRFEVAVGFPHAAARRAAGAAGHVLLLLGPLAELHHQSQRRREARPLPDAEEAPAAGAAAERRCTRRGARGVPRRPRTGGGRLESEGGPSWRCSAPPGRLTRPSWRPPYPGASGATGALSCRCSCLLSPGGRR